MYGIHLYIYLTHLYSNKVRSLRLHQLSQSEDHWMVYLTLILSIHLSFGAAPGYWCFPNH